MATENGISETDEHGAPENQSGSTETGHGTSADINAVLDTLSPDQQATIKEWQKRTLGGMTKASQEAATLRRMTEGLSEEDLQIQRAIKADPALRGKLEKVVSDYQSGKLNPDSKGSDKFKSQRFNERTLKLSKSDQDRQGFETLQELISDYVEEYMEQKLNPKLKNLEQVSNQVTLKGIQEEITKLQSNIGKPLFEKYEKEATEYLRLNTRSTVEQAYRATMEPDDYISAFGRKSVKTVTEKMGASALKVGPSNAGAEKPLPKGSSENDHRRDAVARSLRAMGLPTE